MDVLKDVRLTQTDLAALPASLVVSTLSGLNVAPLEPRQAHAATELVPAPKVVIPVFLTVEFVQLKDVEMEPVMLLKTVVLAPLTAVAATPAGMVNV